MKRADPEYPSPTSRQVSAVMKANRKADTRPEVAVRSALHRHGKRFRKSYPLRLPTSRLVRIDIAIPRLQIAVFVDGCFWHCCPVHGNTPAANRHYWKPKLMRNCERDRDIDRELRAAGWEVVRIWEHVPAHEAAVLIVERMDRRSTIKSPTS